jgi:hypothetical protein
MINKIVIKRMTTKYNRWEIKEGWNWKKKILIL